MTARFGTASIVPIAALALVAVMPVTARADDCLATVVAAEIAQAKQPYAATGVTTEPGKPDEHTEIITLSDKMYLHLNGAWQAVPWSAEQTIDRVNKNAKDPKGTCTREGSEAIGGEASTIFSNHTDLGGHSIDARLWVSDRKGLPLKSEIRFGDGKTMTMTYRYDNVQAPEGVK